MFATNIEANHIQKKGDQYSAAKLTDEDKNEIRALARDPRIGMQRLWGALPGGGVLLADRCLWCISSL